MSVTPQSLHLKGRKQKEAAKQEERSKSYTVTNNSNWSKRSGNKAPTDVNKPVLTGNTDAGQSTMDEKRLTTIDNSNVNANAAAPGYCISTVAARTNTSINKGNIDNETVVDQPRQLDTIILEGTH